MARSGRQRDGLLATSQESWENGGRPDYCGRVRTVMVGGVFAVSRRSRMVRLALTYLTAACEWMIEVVLRFRQQDNFGV